jgi:soluble lytic murein transglycosylase-like protein
MPQILKVVSLLLVMGLSLVPWRAHPTPVKRAPALVAQPTGALATASLKLDERTSADWTATQAALDAEAAAEAAAAAVAEAQRQAEAAARQAAFNPVPAGPRPSVGYVQDLIRQAFAPQGQAAVDWGLRVAGCESGYNPNAYNPDGASGVFQFMPGTFRSTPYGNQNIFDAAANVNAGAWYFQQHGGGAWSCK